MLLLYVVQEKRLVGPLSLLSVDPGVPPTDFLATFVFGVTGCCGVGSALAKLLPFVDAIGACLFVGVIGLGYE